MYPIVGVFNAEGPPVPIPNTEVKLCSAENTCLATDWEDRSMPTLGTALTKRSSDYASLAQSVEHAAVNRGVVGSSPTGGATSGHAAADQRGGVFIFRSALWPVGNVGL